MHSQRPEANIVDLVDIDGEDFISSSTYKFMNYGKESVVEHLFLLGYNIILYEF